MSDVKNDVYENLKKQKRKSVIFAVSLIALLVAMAIISIYFIVFDNIDSFLGQFQNSDIQYETVSDDLGFTYKINGDEAKLVDYSGNEKIVDIPSNVNDADVVYIESFNNEDVVEITIPDSVLYIEDKAFYHMDKLKTVKGCKMVTSVGEGAFKGCTSLENYPFTENLISMEHEAFCNTNLKNVIIPPNMTGLNKRVFNSCRNLEEVTIGAGIISINDQCFKNCKKLSVINCYGGTMSFDDEVFTNCSDNLIIYCNPDSDINYYCELAGIKTQAISE